MHNFDPEIIAIALIKQFRQGLEGYSQGAAFDQNMVRDWEKHKFFADRIRELTALREAGFNRKPGNKGHERKVHVVL